MPHPTITPSALEQFAPRLRELCAATLDIFVNNLEQHHQVCVHAYCRSLWERLDASERDAIRDAVAHSKSDRFGPSRVTDFDCIDAIQKLLQASGAFPSFAVSIPNARQDTPKSQ